MSDKGKTNATLATAVNKLGAGFKGGRGWARRPIPEPDHDPAVPVASSAAAVGDVAKDDSVKAEALREGYKYRRPVPVPDEKGDKAMGKQDGNKDSALPELEDGLTAAANGPPHRAGDGDRDGGDGGDGADDGGAGGEDGLSTAHSSSITTAYNSSLNDEDDAGSGGQEDKTGKRACSFDPANFQEDREAARNLLSMGAFFSSMGKAMLDEHKRARTEADMYMAEVILATGKLRIIAVAVF